MKDMVNWNIGNDAIEAAVIVAHPDDETIFCGGTILCNPDWNWKILCMTGDETSERYRQLETAIENYRKVGVKNISCQTLGYKDGQIVMEEKDKSGLEMKIRELGLSSDIVFSHNSEGEYGHFQHKILSNIVSKIYPNTWEFICPGATNVIPQPFKHEIKVVPLQKQILIQKTKIFNSSYTSELSQWVYLSDLMMYEFKTGPEIFTSEG